LEDLNVSGLKYSKKKSLHDSLVNAQYEGLQGLNVDHLVCPKSYERLKRLFLQGDVAAVAPIYEAEYVASLVGMFHKTAPCYLDENVLPINNAMYSEKRHPVVDKFNVIIRLCIEAGLAEKHWSELSFSIQLSK
jgi:hypothetical protein